VFSRQPDDRSSAFGTSIVRDFGPFQFVHFGNPDARLVENAGRAVLFLAPLTAAAIGRGRVWKISAR